MRGTRISQIVALLEEFSNGLDAVLEEISERSQQFEPELKAWSLAPLVRAQVEGLKRVLPKGSIAMDKLDIGAIYTYIMRLSMLMDSFLEGEPMGRGVYEAMLAEIEGGLKRPAEDAPEATGGLFGVGSRGKAGAKAD